MKSAQKPILFLIDMLKNENDELIAVGSYILRKPNFSLPAGLISKFDKDGNFLWDIKEKT